jgi:hypothetical protein
VRASDSSHIYARVFTAPYIYVANTNTSLGVVNLLLSAGDVLTVVRRLLGGEDPRSEGERQLACIRKGIYSPVYICREY